MVKSTCSKWREIKLTGICSCFGRSTLGVQGWLLSWMISIETTAWRITSLVLVYTNWLEQTLHSSLKSCWRQTMASPPERQLESNTSLCEIIALLACRHFCVQWKVWTHKVLWSLYWAICPQMSTFLCASEWNVIEMQQSDFKSVLLAYEHVFLLLLNIWLLSHQWGIYSRLKDTLFWAALIGLYLFQYETDVLHVVPYEKIMIIWTFVDFWNRCSLTTDVSHGWYQDFCQGAGPGAGFHRLQLNTRAVYQAGDTCHCIRSGCATPSHFYLLICNKYITTH